MAYSLSIASSVRRTVSSALFQTAWPTSSAVPPLLDPAVPIEEERTPYYGRDLFHPARLGDLLNDQYQLVTKLGYGSSSTVWLARDLSHYKWQTNKYVALKINAARGTRQKDVAGNELQMHQRIQQTTSPNQGQRFIRRMTDHFTLDGQDRSKHVCLVFEPLREPLWIYRRRFANRVIPPVTLKLIVRQILHGLDFLHRDCHIIHTDIKPDNIMLQAENADIFEREALHEYSNPLPQKLDEQGRTVFLSRNDFGRPSEPIVIVRITDLGLSVLGETENHGAIQAEVFRAPEVVLDAGYSYPADIWSLGAMLWDLLQGTALFDLADPGDKNECYDDNVHLACITALLGPAPRELVERGRRSSMFYDEQGGLKDPSPIPTDFTFERTIHCMTGQEKELFLSFVKRMLTWDPKLRSTAKELLDDPWLYSGLML